MRAFLAITIIVTTLYGCGETVSSHASDPIPPEGVTADEYAYCESAARNNIAVALNDPNHSVTPKVPPASFITSKDDFIKKGTKCLLRAYADKRNYPNTPGGLKLFEETGKEKMSKATQDTEKWLASEYSSFKAKVAQVNHQSKNKQLIP